MKTSTRWFAQLFEDHKKILFGLVLPILLAGCAAPSIRPAASQVDQLHSILIVPVEAPPLEVIPDLIERRDPAYRHAQNMVLGLALPTKLYQTAGGILVTGMVYGDQTQHADAITKASPTNAGGFAKTDLHWTPALVSAQKLRNLLAVENRKSELSRDYYHLPWAEGSASLPRWHEAIQAWYGLDWTPVNYVERGDYDAILEVGVGRYRIFEGQTSLQVMIKLIDPVSRRVIARTLAQSFKVDDEALASLDDDGAAFKELIGNMAVPLLRQTLGDIGLRMAPQADET
ncbi:hypothetical protein [Methylomonas fluvii]|uniref:Lipoprotein n=1 Tax=Methylomonas fluvii TaxID=1854564 RepID=A0ABR9DEH1_9GAMM|nr:hypothetical protein [Methylomonas fluvii]MBD9360654.1 hypothetical protein [Methylomonas fluvii]CAD6873501.1 hypothetical protein [Methylomonas fluvii]